MLILWMINRENLNEYQSQEEMLSLIEEMKAELRGSNTYKYQFLQ
jgi:hypothetical protein